MAVPRLKPRKATLPKLQSISDRIYNTTRWRRISKFIRQNQRLCAHCGEALVEEVHHVVPIEAAPRLAYDVSNLVGLCRPCHLKVHEGDRIVFGHAKRRGRGGHTPPI
jgi:5-methylcytosine-specific restriction endonuclease McrA